MGWWVCLQDSEGNNVRVDAHSEGGIYVVGGTDEAELKITYNYSRFYYQYLNQDEGLRWLDGKQALLAIEQLRSAVKELGTERVGSYWEVNEGNAGYALSILLAWAEAYPGAIFAVH